MTLRLCVAILIVIASSPALAETLACSTTFQGYHVCQGPGGYRSTETHWQGMVIGPGQRRQPLDHVSVAGHRHHSC
jgi:hypothetical protein